MATPHLDEVFGISGGVRKNSYVDRGRLDGELRYLLGTDRHIVIHGDAKQGKTWLREAALGDDLVIKVQCLRSSTPASVFEEALGVLGIRATLRYSRENSLGGEIDLSASGEIGVKFLAKAKAEGRFKGTANTTGISETAPIGRTAGDLSWVAFMLRESNRRLVLEDFHYLTAAAQEDFSFLLKALLEYGVTVIVMGVWAEDQLLTYYNGDLSGRVEDIRLEWTDVEFEEVLARGLEALNIALSPEITAAIVSDSFGNVGLLQRQAERICRQAGVMGRASRRGLIDDRSFLEESQIRLSEQMAGRFLTFARRMVAQGVIYGDVLRAVVCASEANLLNGIRLEELPAMIVEAGGGRRTKPALREKLLDIGEAQSGAQIQPPVLAWDQPSNSLFLVDRAFLFYRKYGSPSWPWEM